MSERVRLARRVAVDWATLTPQDRAAASLMLERIDSEPIAGVPLYDPLRGVWSYKLGELRVLYRLIPGGPAPVVLSIRRTGERS